MDLKISIDDEVYSHFLNNKYSQADIIAVHTALYFAEPQETITEFADRCKQCGARYGKLLELKSDRIKQIRAEIERLHHHPKLDFIRNDDIVEMVLEIIDKYKAEGSGKE